MQFDALFYLPLSDLKLDQYSLSHIEKPVIFPRFLSLFRNSSMNINPIANLRTGDEIEHRTGHSMYRLCCDTMGIKILNCSQSCWNRKMEPQSGLNQSLNLTGIHACPGNNLDWSLRSGSKPGPQPGNPELLLTLHVVESV